MRPVSGGHVAFASCVTDSQEASMERIVRWHVFSLTEKTRVLATANDRHSKLPFIPFVYDILNGVEIPYRTCADSGNRLVPSIFEDTTQFHTLRVERVGIESPAEFSHLISRSSVS